MRKAKTELKTIIDSRVYNLTVNGIVSKCPICAPHRGCNVNRDNNHKNWKQYRKTQWRDKRA